MSGPVKIEHRDAFVKSVAAALRDRCKVPAGARVLVAVSGGADSVALLRALALLASLKPWRLELSVVHVQHHLRGDAERDAALAAELAKSLNLPFLRADLSPEDRQGNLENWARRERYAALATMAHAIDADFIATAHHADDQLETLLMRLMRGASVRGMRGMRWRARVPGPGGRALGVSAGHDSAAPGLTRRLTLIRPLLAVDREEIVRFLRELNQRWCEDQTNTDSGRVRSRLRRDVLPVLRELKADVARRSTALSDHLQQVSRVLGDLIDIAADRVIVTGRVRTFDRTDARTLRPVVLAGLLRRLLIASGAKPDRIGENAMRPVIRSIRDGAGGERTFDFSGGVRVKVTRSEITVEAPTL